jgi:tRNA(Ile)-lysidine synthase
MRMVRSRGRLELQKSREPRVEFIAKSWRWHEDRRLILGGETGALELMVDAAGPVDLGRLPAVLSLRPRVGGERLRPSARARSRTLKSLLQTEKIPAEERARLPLLFAGEHLIAVGDRWIDASIAATVKSRRCARIKWTRGR